MIHEYIKSEEKYKGFIIKMRMVCLDNKMNYHKHVDVYKDGERISVGKSKKEIKDLIDGGYIK